jgi:hypothetical protein
VECGFRALLRALFLGSFLFAAAPLVAAPPKVNFFFPAGGQRGQSVAVTASGEFANWPVQVWPDRPGVTATCEMDKGKLKVEVAADAAAGVYWLRLTDGEGASPPRPFVVGTLPEADEAESSEPLSKRSALSLPVVVNGKLQKSGDEDVFLVNLQQGQTLVASLQAHSLLGSPMDAVLQVCEVISRTDPVSREPSPEVFIAAQNHDSIGLDPQLAFAARTGGLHLVRLFAFPSEPNSTIGFAGGDNYVYRLTLTTGGFVDHALPLAIGPEAAQVRFQGWNLPEMAVLDVPAGAEPLTWLFHPEAAGAWPAARSGRASLVAADTSDPSQPQEVALPVAISGRLEREGDADAFAFAGKKDQKVRARVEARSLGFPTDAVLSLLDAGGQVVVEQDDTARDSRDPVLDMTLPADGNYRVVIRDLAGRGSLRMVYRLTLETPEPDFDVSLAADSFLLEGEKPLEIPLTVTGRDGFSEAVEIRVLDLPAGVTAEPLTVQATGASGEGQRGGRRGRRGGGPSAPPANAKLILKADPSAAMAGGGPIRIEGRLKDDEGEIVRAAQFPLGLPLTDKHAAVWLTVKK